MCQRLRPPTLSIWLAGDLDKASDDNLQNVTDIGGADVAQNLVDNSGHSASDAVDAELEVPEYAATTSEENSVDAADGPPVIGV